MKFRRWPPLAALLALTAAAAAARGDESVLLLPLGPANLKNETQPVELDVIRDQRSGSPIAPADLGTRLQEARIVLAGEEHTSMDFHRVQLALIQALHEQGRTVIVGLEMFPFVDQEVLDDWVAGYLTEPGFVQRSRWYTRWGYHWHYYRDIFLYARRNGLAMKGLNAPREVISTFRKQGRDALSEEQAAHLPPEIDVQSDEHMRLFRAYFESDDPIHADLTEEQWRGMFSAQAAWDAVMGFNALKALEGAPEDAVVVVLVGAGHVAYGLGIARQIANWSGEQVATVLPVPVADARGRPVERVQASYADIVWGIPAQGPPLYPVLGTATITSKGALQVIDVAADSPAQRAGIQPGDRLTALNGEPIPGRGELNRLMAARRWGDTVILEVQRDGESLTVNTPLRRAMSHRGDE